MSCFAKCQRQGLTSWRLCLMIFTIISSTGYCKSTADSFGTSAFSLSSSSSSPRKTLDQEIGSPSELAWQAWLLVENKSGGQSALESANILRKITPKSIFIAPELISCPNGYTSDGKGTCKPVPIKIDEDAQRQFFLKRLNALYGKFGNNRKKPAEVTGPLQINIPILLPTKSNSPNAQPVQPLPHQKPQQLVPNVNREVVENRPPISVDLLQQSNDQKQNNGQESEVTVAYKVDNDTKKEQKESTREEGTNFFLDSPIYSGPKKDIPNNDEVVPVAEFIDEANDTFSTDVVDYKIPLGLAPTLNRSDVFDNMRSTSNRHEFHKITNGTNSQDDSSPTVVLLLSPTLSPFHTSTQSELSKTSSFEEAPVDRESEHIENTSPSSMEEETKSESDTTIHTVAPLITQTAVDSIDSTMKNTEKTYEQDTPADENVYIDEESHTEQEFEDRDNYDDTTDEVDESDFEESEDELLKTGEAGMMMSHKNRDIIRDEAHRQYKTTVIDVESATSTSIVDTTPMPTFPSTNIQDSFDVADITANTDLIDYTKEDVGSTQTTEIPTTLVTDESNADETTTFPTKQLISDDLFKTAIRRNHTQYIIKNNESDNKTGFTKLLELERDATTEPKIIFSTQGSHSITTSYGNKRPAHPVRVVGTPFAFEEFDDVVSKTEYTPVGNFHRYNSPDEKYQKLSIISNSDPILFKNDGNIPSDFKDQMAESSKPSSMNLRRMPSQSTEDSFVRFPDRNSETPSQRHDYVRFPPDEVNSIHNQDNYKDHLLSPYHSREEYSNSSPASTKGSVPTRQKPLSTHWRIPSAGMRMDRQHQQSQQQIQGSSSTANHRQQKQKPMLLRFWARMPLVRDLTFYPTTSHGSHNEPIGGPDDSHRSSIRYSPATTRPGRRINHHKEMSSHDVNRLLAQQLGQSAHGD
ncbi:PREDICTED: uncharacterized protein LOC105362712 [Ceratosolen solmsi marchali]|uniref:Uncharacterized protein LOC105362712 n=1 Tax=Ceratosolen solmsi marchali TaxID=326594 RepID=A0AAJ6YI53_9HYME|nr:PREDICTED: uncharacterized protein LOC105362712 [Ceratosolen solmsi marchali]